MATLLRNILIFFLTWNFLATNTVQGYYITIPVSELYKLLPADSTSGNSTLSNDAQTQPQSQSEDLSPGSDSVNYQIDLPNQTPNSPLVSNSTDSQMPTKNKTENYTPTSYSVNNEILPQIKKNAPISYGADNQGPTLAVGDNSTPIQIMINYSPYNEMSTENNKYSEAATNDNQQYNETSNSTPTEDESQPQPQIFNSASFTIPITVLQATPTSQGEEASNTELETVPQGIQASENERAWNTTPKTVQREAPSPTQDQGETDVDLSEFSHDTSAPQDQEETDIDPRALLQALLGSQDQGETNNEPSSYEQQYQDSPNNGTEEPIIILSCNKPTSEDSSTISDDYQSDIQLGQDDDSQNNIQLSQVTASQILYHMNVKYEKMSSQEGNTSDSYEALQMFFTKMLRVSQHVTVEDNKDIVSTTYAAYYSTEYLYTFALCKLHHITGGPQNSQNEIDPQISSQCAQVVEKFTSLSVLYEKVVSQSSNGGKVLQYDVNESALNDDGDSTNQNSAVDPSDEKVHTWKDETIQNSDLEKDLHGYNDDNFYSRQRSERSKVDQYDTKVNQQTGDSTYSQETKGQENNFSSLMLSEMRGLAGNLNANDPTDGQKILKKSINKIYTQDEAVTKERLENDEQELDSARTTKYDRSDEELKEVARNYFDDDEDDIGGNIENAKIQEVETHQTSTVEHFHDESEQTVHYKNQDDTNEKYTFAEAVQKLVLYIRTLHAFTSNMETDVNDKNNSSDGQGKDVYTEMYNSVYEKTIIYRRYLRKYFTNVNVEKGTFNGTSDVDSQEGEISSSQLSIQRYLWLQSAQSQETSDVSSNPLKLLWYFEEANFYYMHLKKTQTNVQFMSYLPYPDFNVKTDQNNENGADIQFYLN